MASLRDGVADYVLREGLVLGSAPPQFVRDEGRRYTAKDIPCDECGAAEGDACTGPLFCGQRIQAAVELARAGQLDSLGPAAVVVQCKACAWFTGKRWACTIASHRCPKRDGKGQQCPQAIEAGTRYCANHDSQAVARAGSGRKPLLSDAQLASRRSSATKRARSGKRSPKVRASASRAFRPASRGTATAMRKPAASGGIQDGRPGVGATHLLNCWHQAGLDLPGRIWRQAWAVPWAAQLREARRYERATRPGRVMLRNSPDAAAASWPVTSSACLISAALLGRSVWYSR